MPRFIKDITKRKSKGISQSKSRFIRRPSLLLKHKSSAVSGSDSWYAWRMHDECLKTLIASNISSHDNSLSLMTEEFRPSFSSINPLLLGLGSRLTRDFVYEKMSFDFMVRIIFTDTVSNSYALSNSNRRL